MPTRQCPMGGPKCHDSICDCFIDEFPDDPLGLHPEVFIVGVLKCSTCEFTASPDHLGVLIMNAHTDDHKKDGEPNAR